MLSKSAAVQLVGDQLFALLQAERTRLAVMDDWATGKNPKPWAPRTATSEHRALMEKSITPLLGLIPSSLSQATYVDGYRSPRQESDAPAWQLWQANGFDARQVPLHRSIYRHGYAYVTTLPGVLNGERMPVARAVSGRSMIAVYTDPADDEWPMYALSAKRSGQAWILRLFDDDAVHTLGMEDDSSAPEYITFDEHDMGVTPVTRLVNQMDLEGNAVGEIEPYIPVAARIDQTTFDRLMVQRYSSWKVRFATGLQKPETPAEEAAVRLKLSQDDLLIGSNPATKFGTLDETSMDPFTAARSSDIEILSAVAQMPPQYFGRITNLSADALALAQATMMRKVSESHVMIGEGHEQWLGLGARWLGLEVDPAAQVRWRDVESRSLAQLADAWGKIVTMLGFPPQMAWEHIPSLTQTEIEQAKQMIKQNDSLGLLNEILERQSAATNDTGSGDDAGLA